MFTKNDKNLGMHCFAADKEFNPDSVTSPGIITSVAYISMLKQPHLLITGKTGSGKSVLINDLIFTAAKCYPMDSADGETGARVSQFIFIDPKGVELVMWCDLPHTLAYATEPDECVSALQLALRITKARNKIMRESKPRKRKWDKGDIYVIIDEFADLMTTNKKRVQPLVQRLCQIGRSAKVHVILATQCPQAKIIPTEIKVNFDSRVCLKTSSVRDSRYVLDMLNTLDERSICYYLPDPETDGQAKAVYVTPHETSVIETVNFPQEELDEMNNWWTAQVDCGAIQCSHAA